MSYRKTPVAAREIGATYHMMMSLIRYATIPAPGRDSSGDYLWSDEDLERARAVFAARRQKREARHVVA